MDKDIDIFLGKKAREFLDALLNSIEAGFTQVFERHRLCKTVFVKNFFSYSCAFEFCSFYPRMVNIYESRYTVLI